MIPEMLPSDTEFCDAREAMGAFNETHRTPTNSEESQRDPGGFMRLRASQRVARDVTRQLARNGDAHARAECAFIARALRHPMFA